MSQRKNKPQQNSVWSGEGIDPEAHFGRLRRWLELESEAEKRQFQENIGRKTTTGTLLDLRVRESNIGMGGNIYVTFGVRNQQARLPSTRLSVGSPVILSVQNESERAARGIVARINRRTVTVAFPKDPDCDGETVRIDLSRDEVTRQRLEQTLARVASAHGNRLAQLRDVLLGRDEAQFSRDDTTFARPHIAHLNDAQQAAVRFALTANDVALIHGPPGTGKTTTVVALMLAAVAHGEQVLACAPSNLAVDNLVEGLANANVKIVRLGNPVRVLPTLQAHTLDALVSQHANQRLATKLRKEAYGLYREADKYRRARPQPGYKRGLRSEARDLFAEARQLERLAVEQVLDNANIVLATLTGLDSNLLGTRMFDLCVIDEAGQSTEPATWIPVVRSQKVVLAGDPQQLPPTILSQQAQAEGFGVSLLERLQGQAGDYLSRQLVVQYRMHTAIMGFSSAEFYANSLQADASVQNHLLCDLPDVTATPLTTTPLTYIDTAGASYDEELTSTQSRRNPQEATLAVQLIDQLLEAGVLSTQISVITPYTAQVDWLREQLADRVEVGSVDGVQGREQEVVIISLVRSNLRGEIGFLAEIRRLNVALTRARRKLILIGDSATISSHPFFARLLDYFEQQNAYSSVWEL